MAKDYIPTAEVALRTWLINLKKSVSSQGAECGLSALEISTAENLCSEYIAQIDSARDARAIAKGQVSAKKAMLKTHQPKLRHTIKRMKSVMNASNAKTLKLMAHKEALDETYKPQLKLKMTGQHIEVKFKKRGISGIHLKVKIGVDHAKVDWIDLGRFVYSPIQYIPEGYPQGSVVPVWFVARAIVKDKPFGQESDLCHVLFEMP